MILYLDASALVKRYVAESGSKETNRLIAGAKVVGTAVVSRAEVPAAFAKAAKMKLISRDQATVALESFRAQWNDLARLQITESLIARADVLAWDLALRGYDAVHLAAALLWQETLGETVTLATFDRQLWEAAQDVGQQVFPVSF